MENLRRVDRLPSLLAVLFGVVALLTLGHTLVSSVRQRSRDFAILRAIGFVRGQVAAAVAWQATIVAAVALALGLPAGASLGRWSWRLITDRLGLSPDPVVPGLILIVLASLSLVTANLVAVVPALLAARTRAIAVLHAE